MVFQGYPGGRRNADEDGLNFGRMTFDISVADTSGAKILADVSRVKRIEPHQLPALADPYGGCSGSPVFLRRPGALLRMVGITTTYGLKTLTFVHISCVKSDGTISDFTA
jgi:hypothetical protein